jgi:hypothetical protein
VLEIQNELGGWLHFDDATVWGWATTVGYLLAAWLCARAAASARRSRSALAPTWRILAVILLVLGLNKQLDLQTVVFRAGSRIILALGWYEQKNAIQTVAVAAFGLGLFACGVLLVAKGRRFLPRDPWFWLGIALLGAFLLLRAAVLANLKHVFGFSVERYQTTKLIELSAVWLLAFAAFRGGRRIGS